MPRTLPFDIARCASKTCPHRSACARATDLPESANILPWFGFDPWCGDQQMDATDCLYFIPNNLNESEKSHETHGSD